MKRLDWFTRAVAAAFLICIAFSGSLWLSNRLYPLVPVANLIGSFAPAIDYGAFILLIALLVALILQPRSRVCKFILLFLLAILFLQDQNRLWPSFYEFSFFFLVLASLRINEINSGRGASRLLATSQFILAAVYFWSGLLKFTPSFYYSIFPWFTGPLTAYAPAIAPYVPLLGGVAAAIEVIFALGLLTKRFRRFSFWEANLMHVLIFFLIGPLNANWNDSAWIWSMATWIFLWILFYKAPPFEWRKMLGLDSDRSWRDPALLTTWLAVLCIGVLPALNIVNAWPSALSFNVYTGNVAAGEISLNADVVPRLPPALQPFVVKDYTGTITFDINAWSAATFNANPVPAKAVFLALLAKVCSYAPATGDVKLVYQEKSGWGIPASQSIYTCASY